MARSRKPGTAYRSPEWRERIAAGLRRSNAHRRDVLAVLPGDLVLWSRRGTLRPDLCQLVELHGAEMGVIGDALGGLEKLSPQRQALLRDFCRLGVATSLVAGRMLSRPDGNEAGELASRLATLSTARARVLGMLGLDERHDELDLPAYLAKQKANGGVPGAPTTDAPNGAHEEISIA